MPVENFSDRFPFFQLVADTGWILETRTKVNKADVLRSKYLVELIDIQSVRVKRDRFKAGAEEGEALQGGQVSRLFKYHMGTWFDKEFTHQIDPLLSARSDKHLGTSVNLKDSNP
jgi:hypothetical protein